MSVNIDDINTVDDLINAQSKNVNDPKDRIVEMILAEDPDFGLDICCAIITALREFHTQGINHYIEENKADCVAQWALDYSKLDKALDLISDIAL